MSGVSVVVFLFPASNPKLRTSSLWVPPSNWSCPHQLSRRWSCPWTWLGARDTESTGNLFPCCLWVPHPWVHVWQWRESDALCFPQVSWNVSPRWPSPRSWSDWYGYVVNSVCCWYCSPKWSYYEPTWPSCPPLPSLPQSADRFPASTSANWSSDAQSSVLNAADGFSRHWVPARDSSFLSPNWSVST